MIMHSLFTRAIVTLVVANFALAVQAQELPTMTTAATRTRVMSSENNSTTALNATSSSLSSSSCNETFLYVKTSNDGMGTMYLETPEGVEVVSDDYRGDAAKDGVIKFADYNNGQPLLFGKSYCFQIDLPDDGIVYLYGTNF